MANFNSEFKKILKELEDNISDKNALETAIHSINVVEPGIYKKLMDEYQN